MTTINQQKTMFSQAMYKSSNADHAFIDLLMCESNPLTAKDLERNIERRPELWSKYSGFLPYLRGRESTLNWG